LYYFFAFLQVFVGFCPKLWKDLSKIRHSHNAMLWGKSCVLAV